jgi:hypothetical protein
MITEWYTKGMDSGLPNNSNKGIVNNDYEPYTDLITQMKEINERFFDLIEYFDSQKNHRPANRHFGIAD